jgi:hypothetical protein
MKSKNIKIDKKVPLPPPRGTNKHYPLAEMKIGDSFWAPPDEVVRARSAASQHGSRHQKKFTTRTEDDGLRVWRIE